GRATRRSPLETIGLALPGIGLLLLLLLIRRPEPEGVVPWEMLGDRDDPPVVEPEPEPLDPDADLTPSGDDGEPVAPPPGPPPRRARRSTPSPPRTNWSRSPQEPRLHPRELDSAVRRRRV